MKGAIFDLDGTLIDSLFYWDKLWEKLGEKYLSDKSFRPGIDMEKAVRSVTFVDASKMIFNKFGFGNNYEEISGIMHTLPVEIYKHEVTLKPGVKELLAHLKACGIKMCIASASMPEFI